MDEGNDREKPPREDDLLCGAVPTEVMKVERIDVVWVSMLIR